MSARVAVACVQMTSTPDIARNIALSSDLVRAAHAQGAQLVGLPEVVNLCQRNRNLSIAAARTEAEEPALAAYRALAAELGIWLLAGSLVVKLTDDERMANRSFLIDPQGNVAARYDKIHMFDVDLANGERYRESATFRPGDRMIVADTPWGGLGMTVCYDIRFPYLYRALAKAGAGILAVPAAFTRPTGQAHWHVLLRARAIETGCFVIAPAQCGIHEDGRQTYGHTLIVSPWGEVLADAGEAPGIVMATLDMEAVAQARGMVPSLEHDRGAAPPTQAVLRAAGE